MSNGTPAAMQCPQLPKLQTLSVNLPLGGSLSAMADFSVGTPSNCTMTFNLLVQLTPMLASIACLIKILGVVGALKDVFSGLPTPDLGKLFSAIDEALLCITDVAVPFLPFLQCVKDILLLIVFFLQCFIDELKSILSIMASIDITAAQGDPALTAALQCAQANAQTSMDNLNNGIAGIQPLIQIVTTLASIAGQNISLSIAPPPPGSDPLAAVDHLEQLVNTLKQVANAIPVPA